MRYRIVSRTQYGLTTYYAERKLFGLFWINLPFTSIPGNLPFTSIPGNVKWKDGGENPSTIKKLVENYVEMLISGHLSKKQKVIKTYE